MTQLITDMQLKQLQAQYNTVEYNRNNNTLYITNGEGVDLSVEFSDLFKQDIVRFIYSASHWDVVSHQFVDDKPERWEVKHADILPIIDDLSFNI